MYDKTHVTVTNVKVVSGNTIISCDIDDEEYLPDPEQNPRFGAGSVAFCPYTKTVYKMTGLREWVAL